MTIIQFADLYDTNGEAISLAYVKIKAKKNVDFAILKEEKTSDFIEVIINKQTHFIKPLLICK